MRKYALSMAFKLLNTRGDTSFKNKGVFMENLEILKGKLSESTYKLVEEELKDTELKLADLSTGEYVNADKHKKLEEELTTTKKKVEEQTTKLGELATASTENEALKQQIETLKTDFEKEKTEYQSKASADLKKEKIKYGISGWNVYDVNDVLGLVDAEKVTEENGKLSGLDEQRAEIEKGHPHYFKTDNRASGFQHEYDEPEKDAFEQGFDE